MGGTGATAHRASRPLPTGRRLLLPRSGGVTTGLTPGHLHRAQSQARSNLTLVQPQLGAQTQQ